MGMIHQCSQCGKKGLFLPLNNLGHCEECIKKNKAERDELKAEQDEREAIQIKCEAAQDVPLIAETEITDDEAEKKEEVENMENTGVRKPNVSEKDWLTTLLLCIFLGGLGIHRFYVNKPLTAVLWLLTAGCFGVGVIIDICSIASGSFTDGDGAVILSEKQRDRAHGSGLQDAPPVDVVEQLRKLGELRDSGILSDEEFAAKKSVLLDKIK